EGNHPMPEKRTLERARRKARQGKSASTVAGEFVREEIEDIRKGKHGARSTKQAIAIGLSKARRAGVPLPGKGKRTRKRASAARKGSAPRIAIRHPLAPRQGRLSERGRTTSQAVAKRRARSLKRETGGGAPATQVRSVSAAQGQRKAIRGNRTRQRHT